MADAALEGAGSHRAARVWLARALVWAPGLCIVLGDVASRRARLVAFQRPELSFYVLTALGSVVLWGTLVAAASRREGWDCWAARALLVVLAGFAVGAQVYTFHRYQAYLNHRAVLVGTSMLPSIGQQLWSDRVSFLVSVLPPVLGAVVLPPLIAKLAPVPRAVGRRALDVAIVAILLATFAGTPAHGGEQGATPDVLYLSSLGELAKAHWDRSADTLLARPGARTPLPMPDLVARPSSPRNVLFVLTESVRAMDVCATFEPFCEPTPFTNALLPKRFGFRQMRSLDSTTAVSLAVMWSGLPATATREEFHTAPLLWEYAHAAGYDTAYFTSQHPFFANAGLWLDGLPLSKMVTATELDPEATYELGADDGELVDTALAQMSELREPFAAVVHLSNTHFPYEIDPADAPFQPESEAVGAGDQDEVHNRYLDAIHRQDKIVARLVETVRARPEGARTVVVFLSDHGEQIRERGAIGHTGTVHDEEIRIAAWLDAPEGTLSAAEVGSLRGLVDTELTALDVLPTLLDLMGVWDAPGVAGFRAKMPGESLLRGGSAPERPVVLTNCTTIFACAFRNWGVIAGRRKLLGTQDDHAWRCYDVLADPYEVEDLGEEACEGLPAIAEADGRGRPF